MRRNILFLLACLLFSSCATYHISPESLVQQFEAVHPEQKHTILVAFPLIIPFTVTGNDLRTIQVLDKDNKEYKLPVTRHTSVKITQKSGKKKTFYFSTLLLKDSTVTGSNSTLIKAKIKPIVLSNISKIELQKH
ncbi:MAG: hypothetical protein P4L41_10720 [Flavipsychrobacter sp.]|nr:hypothetical protein [Flavipsychrobacter sp.]